MAYSKKPMSENEKKAKLTALKSANSMATDAMKHSLGQQKDSPALKKHVKEMSDESDIDFKNDSDSVVDPRHYGSVVGRHISDENEDCEDVDMSVYDIDERLNKLMAQKAKMKGY